MAAPTYLEPEYITYEMVEPFIKSMIRVTTDPLEDTSSGAFYVGAIKTLIAEAEIEVIMDVLSNYLAVPLQGLNNETFDELYDNPITRQYSYIPIRNMFINCSIWFIYKQYFSDGGNTNGQALTDNAYQKYKIDRDAYIKLDIALNPRLKNAFRGMKRVDNASDRIPKGCSSPTGIPTGIDRSWAAQNAILNLRR